VKSRLLCHGQYGENTQSIKLDCVLLLWTPPALDILRTHPVAVIGEALLESWPSPSLRIF
jgi:hypothetical protein